MKRGLFEFAENFLPKMGYKRRAHLMNDMLPGLNGGKMSASLPDSKIDCLDSPETVRRKIFAVNCEEGDVHSNGILAVVRLVLIPISELRIERSKGHTGLSSTEGTGVLRGQRPFCSEDAPPGTVFTIDAIDGEKTRPKHYKTYQEVQQDYSQKLIPSQALKLAVVNSLNQLLGHVRELHHNNSEWQAAEKLAYPETEQE
jgi:tyrosyl-tRNA synthetase